MVEVVGATLLITLTNLVPNERRVGEIVMAETFQPRYIRGGIISGGTGGPTGHQQDTSRCTHRYSAPPGGGRRRQRRLHSSAAVNGVGGRTPSRRDRVASLVEMSPKTCSMLCLVHARSCRTGRHLTVNPHANSMKTRRPSSDRLASTVRTSSSSKPSERSAPDEHSAVPWRPPQPP